MALRSALINAMANAARKAQRSLIRDFNEVEHLQVSKKGPADFVSAADRKAEKILQQELAKLRPDFGFIMEEGGRIEARYENGLLTGELKTYYPDGSPLGLSTYSAGLLDGPQKTWAPGGILLVEGECRGGLRTGVWTWYEEDGSVSSTVTFAEGKKQGVQTFFEDGVLVKEEVYRDGAYVETRLRR